MDLLFKGASEHYSQLATVVESNNKDGNTVDLGQAAEEKDRLKSVRLLGSGQYVPVNACQKVNPGWVLIIIIFKRFLLLNNSLVKSHAEQSRPTVQRLHPEVVSTRRLHGLQSPVVRTLWLQLFGLQRTALLELCEFIVRYLF